MAPSLLSADFTHLSDEIEMTRRAGARVLHLDVMDGHFVPNITFGPPIIGAIRRVTDQWLDAHLMITDPLGFLEPFARAGADGITVHAETFPDCARLRDEADRLGIGLGLAIRPDTQVDEPLRTMGDLFDLILIMTVMPGFGGQSFIAGSEDRIARAGSWCARAPRSPVLQVDGGIHQGTARAAARAGAGWFVAGSAVFGSSDPAGSFRDLERVVNQASPV